MAEQSLWTLAWTVWSLAQNCTLEGPWVAGIGGQRGCEFTQTAVISDTWPAGEKLPDNDFTVLLLVMEMF